MTTDNPKPAGSDPSESSRTQAEDGRSQMYTIRSLDQLKILGDPLRMRILEAFVLNPGTTKQVAKSLGEPPTKLYHHVDALEKAGLIELRSTRQNRGTLEKHYGAVAAAFRVDPDLLPGGTDPAPTLGLGTEILQRAADDYRRLEERVGSDEKGWEVLGSQCFFSMMEIHANDQELEEISGHIEGLIESLMEESKARFGGEDLAAAAEGRDRHRLVIALYPLDQPAKAPAPEEEEDE